MPLRSITFRCSDTQSARIEQAMRELKVDNRTLFISQALEEFLDFTEGEDVKDLDLFALVERLDGMADRHRFETEA